MFSKTFTIQNQKSFPGKYDGKWCLLGIMLITAFFVALMNGKTSPVIPRTAMWKGWSGGMKGSAVYKYGCFGSLGDERGIVWNHKMIGSFDYKPC